MIYDEVIYNYMKSAHHPQVNSILVWDKGEMLAECYFNGCNEMSRHPIKSIVKSIVSIGIGMAYDEGRLKLDDPIGKYIPEFDEKRDIRHKRIKIEHLLTMSSGINWRGGVHYHCPMMDAMRKSGKWIDYIADCAITEVPGTCHNYKEWDVILLADILSKVTGDCFDYINEKLYKPLGIQSDRWFKSPDGVYYSVALNEEEKKSDLTAKELLSIGILFYQEGIWEDRRLLSKAYIEKAIAPSSQDENYGYLWWRGKDWYGCRGYGIQNCIGFCMASI